VVLGGGNVNQLKHLPPRCRAGENANAFLGGFRMWHPEAAGATHAAQIVSAGSANAAGESASRPTNVRVRRPSTPIAERIAR